jgi:diguanylate cyclase
MILRMGRDSRDGVGTITPRLGARPALAAATGLAMLCGVTLALPAGDARAWISNAAETVVPTIAAAGCLRAARRSPRGRPRRGWAAMALACLSWAAGQVAWTVLESGLGDAVPYPSVADIGYLGFPVFGLAGFFLLSPPASGLQVLRRVLDGLTVGCAIGVVTWLSVLAHAGFAVTPVTAALITTLYPVGDVVLLTVALLTLAEHHGTFPAWRLLGAGALAMALSDGLFVYLTAMDAYRSGGPADWGWWLAFVLFGLAGVLTAPADAAPRMPARRQEGGLLPYASLATAVLAVVVSYGQGRPLDRTAGVMAALLVMLVLVRQYLVQRDNRRLTRDVLAREAQLHRLAFHDPLTGLANRALFLDRLGHALDLAKRKPRPVSVIFCDLDGFKSVNDSLGHAMGDALLVGVAGRFRSALRDSDTLARLGGDEFAVLLERGAGSADVVARALLDSLATPFALDGRTVAVSASLGVATADPRRSPESAAGLLHRADVAMYAVKASGRGGVHGHDPGRDPVHVTPAGTPQVRTSRHTGRDDGSGRLAEALADALDRRAVRAVYQPVVDPETGRIAALEALARWTHEGREIGPEVFVPVAERTGLSGLLSGVMLEHACAQLGHWTRLLGHDRLRVAVNVSPADLTDAGLPSRVRALLDHHGLGRGQLALEVTETPMWRPDEVLDALRGLRGSGVRIAIDDFGTGHSSLSRLACLPLDTLKLDRIFVADVDHDDSRLTFLAGLLDLARHLGLRTIAEGVERPGQLLALRRLRCDLVQGYLTGRPATPEALTPLLVAGTPMLPFGLQPGWRAGNASRVTADS